MVGDVIRVSHTLADGLPLAGTDQLEHICSGWSAVTNVVEKDLLRPDDRAARLIVSPQALLVQIQEAPSRLVTLLRFLSYTVALYTAARAAGCTPWSARPLTERSRELAQARRYHLISAISRTCSPTVSLHALRP